MLDTGIHRIKAEDYHADKLRDVPTLSNSIAKLMIGKSPAHAWTAHPRLNPNFEPTESKVFDIGRAAHRAVLGAGGDYVAYPAAILASNGAASTKEAKAWADEQRAAGRTPLKADDVDAVGKMAEVAMIALAEMGILLEREQSELTALAEVDGVWCRAMVDNAPSLPHPRLGRYLLDFKTCEDATPEACIRSVENYGYDVQWRHYARTWQAATEEDAERAFVFLFQEKKAPFEVCLVRLFSEPGHSSDWLVDAEDRASTARVMWADCLRSSAWPGYPRLIHDLGARSFHAQKWADQKARSEAAAAISPATLAAARRFQSPEGFAS